MNIKQARQRIKEAKFKDSKNLNLNSVNDEEKLSSDDLAELLPEILELSKLTTIYLSSNKLTKINCLKNLSNLTELYLSNNELTDVYISGELKKLKTLYISFNKLTNIYISEELKDLTSVYLSNNELTDVNFLKNLTNLKMIYLRNNNLSDISFLQNLNSLEHITLEGNKLLEKKIGNTIFLNNNPKAISKAYLDFKEAKETQNLILLNEVKIVLIGQGNVGKSSLRISLKEGKCVQNQRKTEGLEVVIWNLSIDKNRSVQFNIWDFGGQEIYHTTHQYFFNSDCLYILVTDYSGRVEWRTNRLNYWLTTIQMIAKKDNSSDKPVVIIVGNKADEQADYKVSEETIKNEIEKAREKYEDLEIVDFFPVSCHTGENIHYSNNSKGKSLIEIIKEQLDKIGANRQIPIKYLGYKKNLKKSGKDFIEIDDFKQYCPEDTDLMRSIFHSIGIITAFSENGKIKSNRLKNLIVLNPEWITKGIYKILSANHLLETNNGIATKDELRGLLSEKKYPILEDIIEMMKEFYICRSKLIDDSQGNQIEKFFFPKFYSNKTPSFIYSFKSNLSEDRIEFRYDYSFISDNIIAFFIFKAEAKFSDSYFWKDGSYITEGKCQAIVEADNEDNSITIIVKGNHSEALLDKIKAVFSEIHKMDFISKPKNEIEISRNRYNATQKEIQNLEKDLREAKFRINKLEKERITFMIQNNQANSSQIGAMGNKNEVKDNVFNQQINTFKVDFQQLSHELELLKATLEEKAKTVEEGKAIAKIENAIEACKEEDTSKTIKYLKEGGKFVFDTAKEIGTNIITNLIEKQITGG